uniref:Uncharacterized protein n=1 Tax=Solanum tuberosum TaxID=4113 RepID=M1DHL2_SOLTU
MEQCRQGKSAKWIRNFVKKNMLGVFGMGVLFGGLPRESNNQLRTVIDKGEFDYLFKTSIAMVPNGYFTQCDFCLVL